jgi:hypothetical protein
MYRERENTGGHTDTFNMGVSSQTRKRGARYNIHKALEGTNKNKGDNEKNASYEYPIYTQVYQIVSFFRFQE